MGQTNCRWGHGPGAWMYHKDLPLPGSITLLQNKSSLHCFDSVPRLSRPLSLTQRWLAGLGSRCIPGPDYRVQHFLNFGGVFLPQDLVLFACFPPPALSTPSSTFLHVSFQSFHCSFHPQQSSVLHCSAARTPKLPVPVLLLLQ